MAVFQRTKIKVLEEKLPAKATIHTSKTINGTNRDVRRPALRNISNVQGPLAAKRERKKGKTYLNKQEAEKDYSKQLSKRKENSSPVDEVDTYTANIKDIDESDGENPTLCAEYVKDIYNYLRKSERRLLPSDYLSKRSEITEKMRTVLINWLIQVHSKFNLLQETLYLTVYTIDRYLDKENVKRSDLQLVGVTAMLLASKYEEMYAPEIGDFVYITDSAYSKEKIKEMEQKMMKVLRYDFSNPLCLQFLRRNSKAGDMSAEKHTLAKFFMELTLISYKFVCKYPSQIAAAALFLAVKVIDSSEWTPTLHNYSGYSEQELMPVVGDMADLVLSMEGSKYEAVKVKYDANRLLRVSRMSGLRRQAMKNYASYAT